VCRFDGWIEGTNPTDAFVLTHGYWSEDEANAKAADLNDEVDDSSTVYFVLPVRVAKPD
jgi:hypothetical protein